MFQKEKFFIFILSFLMLTTPTFAQEKQPDKPKPKPDKQEKVDNKNLTAEQLAEGVIYIYGQREGLKAVRRTEIERGEMVRYGEDGTTILERSSYERRILRGENQEKDRIRLDQKTGSTPRYALVYDATKIFGILNTTVFIPVEEANRGFQASIFHGTDALLRYKENGSTLKLAGKDKQMGVEFYQLDVIDKQNRTTRFNISTKLFRVLSLEYDVTAPTLEKPIRYVKKFYDYRNAQGTYVPWRTVLLANGKTIEEINVSTVTYGTKIEESDFASTE